MGQLILKLPAVAAFSVNAPAMDDSVKKRKKQMAAVTIPSANHSIFVLSLIVVEFMLKNMRWTPEDHYTIRGSIYRIYKKCGAQPLGWWVGDRS